MFVPGCSGTWPYLDQTPSSIPETLTNNLSSMTSSHGSRFNEDNKEKDSEAPSSVLMVSMYNKAPQICTKSCPAMVLGVHRGMNTLAPRSSYIYCFSAKTCDLGPPWVTTVYTNLHRRCRQRLRYQRILIGRSSMGLHLSDLGRTILCPYTGHRGFFFGSHQSHCPYWTPLTRLSFVRVYQTDKNNYIQPRHGIARQT